MSEPADRRPKLLVLASTYPAGADDGTPAFVRDLAVVESSVFDTTVLTPAVRDAPGREHSGQVTVHRFRYFARPWQDLADGAILENLRSRPSRWLQVLPLMVSETIAVARLVRRIRPDVLHVHWIIPQGLAAMIAARGVPRVVTTLGGDVYGLKDPVSRWIIRRVLRGSAAVTTMNGDMRERLLGLGADPQTTLVLPMGADINRVSAAGTGAVREPGRLLFVGRMVEKKGLSVLLEALRGMDVTGLHVRIVGDGPLRAKLEAASQGLPTEFIGALGRDELAAEYAVASVVVFPSVPASSGDQDGLPVALLEAMSAGAAVVASDLPGLNDAVTDDDSGLLVPPGDVDALAGALTQLMADEPLRVRLGAAAGARAVEFSVESIGARYVSLLESIMERGPRAVA